jgi:hypothetical protein
LPAIDALAWNDLPHLQDTEIESGTDWTAGTVIVAEHFGHFIFLPASCCLTLSFAPHEHFNSIAMALPRKWILRCGNEVVHETRSD